MSQRQIAILAGGLGTRLRPLTEKVPKPMVLVKGKPFLHWQLMDLRDQGYTRVVLLVAYLGEQVQDYFGDGSKFGLSLTYVFEKQPLGTGGALRNALPHLDKEFILLNGDSFLRLPLTSMETTFNSGKFEALVSTYDNSAPVPVIPNLKIAGERVLAYEKDAGLSAGFDRIDSGVYLLSRKLVEEFQAEKFMLADLWPPLIARGTLGSFAVSERFYDIGTVERLKEFEEKLSDYFTDPISH